MRSKIVDNVDKENEGRYSELKVMRSAAGWYIGTTYIHPEGWEEPGSRDSGYFRSREEAQKELDRIVKCNDTFALRESP